MLTNSAYQNQVGTILEAMPGDFNGAPFYKTLPLRVFTTDTPANDYVTIGNFCWRIKAQSKVEPNIDTNDAAIGRGDDATYSGVLAGIVMRTQTNVIPAAYMSDTMKIIAPQVFDCMTRGEGSVFPEGVTGGEANIGDIVYARLKDGAIFIGEDYAGNADYQVSNFTVLYGAAEGYEVVISNADNV